MLQWTIIFLVVALIAGVFGFTGIAATSAGIARVLFGIFLRAVRHLVRDADGQQGLDGAAKLQSGCGDHAAQIFEA